MSHSTVLSVSYLQISFERRSKASEEHNTKAAALSIRHGANVCVFYFNATYLYSPWVTIRTQFHCVLTLQN